MKEKEMEMLERIEKRQEALIRAVCQITQYVLPPSARDDINEEFQSVGIKHPFEPRKEWTE